MLERLVKQIEPAPEEGGEIGAFNVHQGTANLILLGDPGAGKSSLFQAAAQAWNGHFLSVRDFLNTPTDALPRDRPIWIDALDETRAGRSDQSTVNLLVRKLYDLKPLGVRLSCRTADWLGKTDLVAFRPYFQANGGDAVVVQLEALSKYEQLSILQTHEIRDAEQFLAEAEQRELATLLENPQTLLLLAAVVSGNNWPASRTELFEKSSIIALGELNDLHVERALNGAHYDATQLIDAAGALCALRLLSSCQGFTRSVRSVDSDIPSFVKLTLEPQDLRHAVMLRRVFRTVGDQSVDYVHRTVAEYLAARWLVKRLCNGLPLGRLMSLIGLDGKPTTSLRGLCAWLATLAPEQPGFLAMDPMGLLMYGDASRLLPADKRRLLDELIKLSAEDPWFFNLRERQVGIASMADPALASEFTKLLRGSASPSLKSLVINSQRHGNLLPEMTPVLRELMESSSQHLALRTDCFSVLEGAGEEGRRVIVDAYPCLDSSSDGLQLRCASIRKLFGKGLGSAELIRLIEDLVAGPNDLPIGPTFGLTDAVEPANAVSILDQLNIPALTDQDAEHAFRKRRDLLRTYESLLIKAARVELDKAKVAKWLKTYIGYARGAMDDGPLSQAIRQEDGLSQALLSAWIEHQDFSQDQGRLWFTFRHIFAGKFPAALVLEELTKAVRSGQGERRAFFYDKALSEAMASPESFHQEFWILHDFADEVVDTSLMEVRNRWSLSAIEPWRIARKDRMRSVALQGERWITEAKEFFLSQPVNPPEGRRFAELRLISEVYFGNIPIEGVELPKGPVDRLTHVFGKDGLELIKAKLDDLLNSAAAPPVGEVLEASARHQSSAWWSAILAGLDLMTRQGLDVNGLPEDVLKSAVAIECIFPIYVQEQNTSYPWQHDWLQRLMALRPDLVTRIYADLVQDNLSRKLPHVAGLLQLADERLSGSLRAGIVTDLLTYHRQAHAENLESLLMIAKSEGVWEGLIGVADQAIGELSALKDSCDATRKTLAIWLWFGFLMTPDRYQDTINALEGELTDEVLWALIERGGLARWGSNGLATYSLPQLEFIALWAAARFPNVPHPTGVSVGTRNDWDGSSAVNECLAQISALTSDLAAQSLMRLINNPVLSTYQGHARHLLSKQRVARSDASYQIPTWEVAMGVLENKAPHSSQDLHSIVTDLMAGVSQYLVTRNTDPYKQFWNTSSHGKIETPKNEELSRDVLIELLKPKLEPHGLRAEPEGHMAADKRADIVIYGPKIKCVIELKRDIHPDLWHAAETQLDRLYTRDPEAGGYGIYGVFWFGCSRKGSLPATRAGLSPPNTPEEMLEMLKAGLPERLRSKISIVVIDVSGSGAQSVEH